MAKWMVLTLLGWSCIGYSTAQGPSAGTQPVGSPEANEWQDILKEIELPPLGKVPPLPRGYQSDGVTAAEIRLQPKKYPLRLAVLDAIEQLRSLHKKELMAEFRAEEDGPRRNQALIKAQMILARRELALQETLEQLQVAGKERKDETSKRWQVHFDYIQAQVQLRLAYAAEYNQALGLARREDLPALDPQQGHNGWRLVAARKMLSIQDVRLQVENAHKILQQLVEEHPQTPWARLAEQDLHFPVGLTWEPAVLPAEKK